MLTYGWDRGDFHAEKPEVTPRGTRFDMITPQEKLPDLLSAHRARERVQHLGGSGSGLCSRLFD